MRRARYISCRGSDPIPEGWDGIRVGSETCPRLLPARGDIRHLSERTDPGRLTLVTPLAGPDEVEDVLIAAILADSLGWGEVVVNDWGVLAAAGRLKGVQITAGRLLMRFRRGPGVLDPWDDLDLSSKRYLAWGPLYDSPFLSFLQEKGVSRIELDPPRHWLPLPVRDGFLYSLHSDNRLIAVSGACPWLYDAGEDVVKPMAACRRSCRPGKGLRMTSPRFEGALLLAERAVFEGVAKAGDEGELPERVDRLIHMAIS